MIFLSFALVVVALVTFLLGIFSGEDGSQTMILVSIGASLLAALTLFIGVMRGRKAGVEAAGPTELITVGDSTSDRDDETRRLDVAGASSEDATLTATPAVVPDDVEPVGEPAIEATSPGQIEVPLEPEPEAAPARARKSAAGTRAAKPTAARSAGTRKAAAAKPAARTSKTAQKPATTRAKPAAAKSAAKPAAAPKTSARGSGAKSGATKSAAKPAAPKTAAKPAAKRAAPKTTKTTKTTRGGTTAGRRSPGTRPPAGA